MRRLRYEPLNITSVEFINFCGGGGGGGPFVYAHVVTGFAGFFLDIVIREAAERIMGWERIKYALRAILMFQCWTNLSGWCKCFICDVMEVLKNRLPPIQAGPCKKCCLQTSNLPIKSLIAFILSKR